MEIKRNIKTKFGTVEAEFIFEDNVWVGSTGEKVCAVIQGDSFDEVETKLIEMYEWGWAINEIIKNNPYRNVVEKELLPKFFSRNWWKLHKN